MSEALEDYALTRKVHKKGTIQKIGIVGCGEMGQEICRILSQFGLEVLYLDISEEKVKMIYESIVQQLDDEINRWGLTSSDKKVILSRIKGSTDYNELSDCEIILESVNSKKPGSNLELRKDVFRRIEAVVNPETIIASNNSTLMISEIASVLEHPDRAIGLHFMSPATIVKIVEVIKGIETSQRLAASGCQPLNCTDRNLLFDARAVRYPNGQREADSKSAGSRLRRFESFSYHHRSTVKLRVFPPVVVALVGVSGDAWTALAQAYRLNPAVVARGMWVLPDAFQPQFIGAGFRPEIEQVNFFAGSLRTVKIDRLAQFYTIQDGLILAEVIGFRHA